jgi:hypothetical protein
MTRKKICVECRHCEARFDGKKGARHYCAKKRRVLPDDVFSRPACGKFALPKISGWGP